MSEFIGLSDSEILDYLGTLTSEQNDIKLPNCGGETLFYKKKHLCQDCPDRKRCMDIEAQKIGLLMILESRLEDFNDPDHEE